MEISASRASASKSPRIPVTCRPWQTALGTLQTAGQGQKPWRRVIARDRLAAAHAKALAEFGELVSWHVETFSRGTPAPKPPREDRDKAGKEALFLEVSRTSRP